HPFEPCQIGSIVLRHLLVPTVEGRRSFGTTARSMGISRPLASAASRVLLGLMERVADRVRSHRMPPSDLSRECRFDGSQCRTPIIPPAKRPPCNRPHSVAAFSRRTLSGGRAAMEAGYLGVGNMGQPMAEKLLDGGHGLTVFDISEAAMEPLLLRQAKRAASPKDLADRCEIVFVSLAAFRAVAFGPEGLVNGKTMKLLVNTCTVGVPFVKEIEQAMATQGVTVVDCPISGGPPGARAGTLSVMVSGDPAAVERIRPMISLWGRTLNVAGDKPGAAQVLKLTNNILSAVALAATAEAFVMGAKGGLDPEVMLAAINAGSGRNSATEAKFPAAVLTRSFDYGAEMHILMKDIDLAIAQGEELGVPMWVCQAARLVFKHAMHKGAAREDLTAIVKYVERDAGFALPKTR
ncbi:MAG TPA: NAD(P)-dependent oxidoreductase, partial [Stellaceae bacterium]